MPKAPATHKQNPIGKSHGQQVRKKVINRQAYSRQQSRQYATNSKQWLAIRSTHIQAHEDNLLCAECLLNGISTLMSDVDHIDGDTFNNEPTSLQSLCKPCHSRKTAREDGGFGNKYA